MSPASERVRVRRRRRLRLELFILLFILLPQAEAKSELRCGAIDIRNTPPSRDDEEVSSLKRCTVVEGSISISMITNSTVVESDFTVFEDLREITGYLLVFQVRALRSLATIFPKLRVIGGQTMIKNYALIIYQNPDLEEVGLNRMTVIRNGGVRIAENSRLCYAKSVDWQHIMAGPVNDLLVDDAGMTSSEECKDVCRVKDPTNCHYIKGLLTCWNQNECQLSCPHAKTANGTAAPGCVEDSTERCHEQCLGGCTKPDSNSSCFACQKLNHKSLCVAECPKEFFIYLDRRCVTKKTCDALGDDFKAVQGLCQQLCPEGWDEDESDKHSCVKCETKCPRRCPETTVDSLATAMELKTCNMIQGNLEIEMRTGMDSVQPHKLTEAFENIEVIEGSLIIRFSPSFVSLHMFKNLRLIKGEKLHRDKYSVVVYENQNLRQLFDPKNKFKVERGKLQFQNNRALCFYKIKQLMESLNRSHEMDDTDQSSYSNGDKAICEESTFDVTVSARLLNGFVLEWPAYNTSDIDQRKFLGYQVFYKQVDKIDANMSMDDDRSACSDSWEMHFEAEKDDPSPIRGSIVAHEGIKSNKLYAYYVQTRMVNHPGARNAVSKIGFVKTKYGLPSAPRMTTGKAQDANQIYLDWLPPIHPNGDITHYIVTWQRQRDEVNMQHVCDVDVPRRLHSASSHRGTASSETEPQSSPSLGASVLIGSNPNKDTCSKISGCCACEVTSSPRIPASDKKEAELVEDAHFENAIQNLVFVQNCAAAADSDPVHCVGRRGGSGKQKRRTKEHDNHRERRHRQHRARRAIAASPSDKDKSIESEGNSTDPTTQLLKGGDSGDYSQHTVNVTDLSFVVPDLKHYGEYSVTIFACQNTSEPDSHCSQRAAFRSIRTLAIPGKDVVNNETIVVEKINGTADARISWEEPEDPNGHILGYRVKITNTALHATPVGQCVNRSMFLLNGKSVSFTGLSDGEYLIEVRTVTLAGTSDPASPVDLLLIVSEGFFTPQRLIIGGTIVVVFLLAASIIVWRGVKFYYGKQVGNFIRQVSANPEYLSQLEVYKADDWELKRGDLIMEEEIGRGTFGQVYRGKGKNVRSECGVVFGDCAIKTVAEGASSAERLHFLIEASVMKRFNTSFIVKLYGVVSDGQPVLVVMEMMAKGNLRDFLRSRRPEAEENTENLPMPSPEQYFEWAAQIADGMAYLERLRFCHRDLAARNCMVHADESVKIGDFGMARDIYYQEYYKPTGKRLMPVRWMAPESLRDGKFTTKSDVWSYGIVLYEMITLAQQPYQGLANDQVFQFIGVTRKILDKPMDCPDYWYDLMVSCWRYTPKERPSFYQIVNHLLAHTSEDFKTKSFVMNCLENGEDIDPGEEPAYVPEGHGVGERHEMNEMVYGEDDEAYLADNRAVGEAPFWNEDEALHMEHEEEL